MSPSTTSNAGTSSSPLLAFGALLRLSLATTAAADIVAGAVFASRGTCAWTELVRPVIGSLCVYHGGMALNDWADRAQDARTRAQRPIPSGRIRAGTALALALVLLAGGPLLAGSWALGAVALLAALYDVAGRGAWRGPVLLGLCRAGNLSAGMLAVGAFESQGAWLAAGYGAYVFLVSRLGRMEDGDEARIGQRPRALLLAAGACQLVPLGFALVPTAPIAALRVGWLALSTRAWPRPKIMQSMGVALRLLLFYSASVAWAGGGPWVGLAILGVGYPLAWGLRQVFPPS
ncbi:MAG: UbiA family prenyltransferase [Planctomycetes bacterium]|nr:UbiA family prenyltransferase [Planctomycetota bacterium]